LPGKIPFDGLITHDPLPSPGRQRGGNLRPKGDRFTDGLANPRIQSVLELYHPMTGFVGHDFGIHCPELIVLIVGHCFMISGNR